MFSRAEFKASAKAVLKKNYWTCFLVTLVILFLSGSKADFNFNFGPQQNTNVGYVDTFADIFGHNMITRMAGFAYVAIPFILLVVVAGIAFGLLVINVLQIGMKKFFLEARNDRYEFKNIGFAYKHPGFWNVVKIAFFENLYVFLWTLLFIIPGIIAGYRYYFVKYIVAENPEIEMNEAFALSKEMTNGIKMDLFILNLSFFGWYLLNIITFGLATFFIRPYQEATDAEVYHAYRNQMSRVY